MLHDKVKLSRIVTTALTLFVLTSSSMTLAQSPEPLDLQFGSKEIPQSKWVTYHDSLTKTSIQYPQGWIVNAPTRKPGPNGESLVGEVTTFSSVSRDNKFGKGGQLGTQIVLGVHMYEYDDQMPFADWATQQIKASGVDDSSFFVDLPEVNYLEKVFNQDDLTEQEYEVPMLSRDQVKVQSIAFQGKSRETGTWKATYILNGQVAFFLWTNANDKEGTDIYYGMLNSLRISRLSPKTIDELYPSLKMLGQNNSNIDSISAVLSDPRTFHPWAGSSGFSITNGPGCGPTHTGISSEAFDYGMGEGTLLVSTANGTVSYAGWNNSGYGNQLIINHGDNWNSLYGHLNGFYVSQNNQVFPNSSVASSGNTGNSTGAHLHFEQRLGNQSQWRRYVWSTTWYTGNASYPCMQPGLADGYAHR
ncbi:MAG TPA: M23 family metallopeptidase [Thermoflexales bacterium]|nr:M23 family metallopeptidase [Thermoflexales bacterium]